MDKLLLCLTILVTFAIAGGCGLTPSPHGAASAVTHQEHPHVVNGEFDWDSEVTFGVANQSGRGAIRVTVTLSTSEGQWTHTQDLLFEKGQTKHLSYFFEEPTINATNYQAVIHVEP